MGYPGCSSTLIEFGTQQCARCDSPLIARDASAPSEASICRPCLRVLDADVSMKKRILFPFADLASEGELLSAFA